MGLGYSIVLFWREEIVLPATDKIIKAMNKTTDHLPERVLGKNVIFIKTHPSAENYSYALHLIYYLFLL